MIPVLSLDIIKLSPGRYEARCDGYTASPTPHESIAEALSVGAELVQTSLFRAIDVVYEYDLLVGWHRGVAQPVPDAHIRSWWAHGCGRVHCLCYISQWRRSTTRHIAGGASDRLQCLCQCDVTSCSARTNGDTLPRR